MKKRIFAILLSFAMMAGMLPAMSPPASAAPMPLWSTDTTAVTPVDNVYTITTPQQLAWIAAQCNGGANFLGKTIVLAHDIDLDGKEWVPMGLDTAVGGKFFRGTFDGKGYVVKNMKIYSTFFDAYGVGLIGTAYNAVIKNVGIVSGEIDIDDAYTAGAICGNAVYSTIQNCYSRINVTNDSVASPMTRAGGLVSTLLDSSLKNLYATGSVSADLTGRILYNQTGSTVENCFYIDGGVVKKHDGTQQGDGTSAALLTALTAGITTGDCSWNISAGVNGGYPFHTPIPMPLWSTDVTAVTPVNNVYTITTPQQLAWIAAQCNDGVNKFSGNTIILANDIDLAGKEWVPIGLHLNTSDFFKGNFDGKGFLIKNMNIFSTPTHSKVGLIGRIESSVIKNVGIVGGVIDVTDARAAGAIAGIIHESTVQNCYSRINVTNPAITTATYSGGLVGSFHVSGTIKNSYTTGAVSGSIFVGPIVSSINAGSTVENCFYLDGAVFKNQSGTQQGDGLSAELLTALTGGRVAGDRPWKITAGVNRGYPLHVLPTPPTITAQPQGTTVNAKASFSLSVTATAGSEAISGYQWKKGGTDISGATSATYSVSSAVAGDSGSYTCVVQSADGNTTSNAATVTVNKLSTSVTLSANPAGGQTRPGSVTLTAGSLPADATGTLTFKKGTDTIATVTLPTASTSFSASGATDTYSLTVEYSGNTSVYNGSTSSALNYSFTKGTGSFGSPAARSATYTPTLTLADVSLPAGYTWNSPATSLSAGDNQSFAATYTDPSGDYTAATGNITVNVAKAAAPTINWPTSTAITYGAALSTSTLSGGSTGFGTFAWTTGATIPTVTNSGYSVTFTPSASTIANYNTITTTTSTVAITVNRAAAPTINWPTSTAITYGAALSTSTLSGGSTSYGTFAWTTGATIPTVSNSGYSVTFTPSASTIANYNTITTTTSTVAITVNRAAAPTINWPTSTAITYGAALSTSALTGGSTEYGSFAWTTGTTIPTVTNSGYSVTFTPSAATIANYDTITTTTSTVAITVNRAAAPTINWPTSTAITYEAALSTSALTGGSTEYGTFAWTTGTTIPTVTNSGYSVTFTPSADIAANYEAITPTTSTVAITVNKAAINLAAIPGVTPPARGAIPVTAVTSPQYTGTVTWSDNPVTFSFYTIYTATITLTPTDNYTLTGVGANFFTVDEGTAINAMNSGVVTVEFPRTESGGGKIPVTPPAASTSSGEVLSGSQITLSSGYYAGKIYYTTDGSMPTTNSTLYTGEPIEITENTTIKMIVVFAGTPSDVVTYTYTVRAPKITEKENASTAQYIKAHSTNLFEPDIAITRYEMIESLAALYDIEKSPTAKSFPDVDDAHRDLVSLFVGAGIIGGFPDGTFGGERGLTRAEFVKTMSLILGLDIKDETSDFGDMSGHWAEKYVAEFAKLGYVGGYPDHTFMPDAQMTRAEFVTVINRIIGIKAASASPVFDDLPSDHWAFGAIMAAYLK